MLPKKSYLSSCDPRNDISIFVTFAAPEHQRSVVILVLSKRANLGHAKHNIFLFQYEIMHISLNSQVVEKLIDHFDVEIQCPRLF